ncbi:MAG: PHP domain-containing protein [Bacillota bacterium]
MGKIDLHLHSYYSCDGEYSPRKLVEIAAGKNLRAVSLTDHNTLGGLKEFATAGRDYALEVIPGIEFDSVYRGKSLHILGYYINMQDSELERFAESIISRQEVYIREIIAYFRQQGFSIEYNDVLKYKNKQSIPGSVTVAEAIVKHKKNREDPRVKPFINKGEKKNGFLDFVREYFPPANDWLSLPPVKKTVEVILAADGIPVLAHPGMNLDPDCREDVNLINHLKNLGLQGMEAFSTYHDRRMDNRFYELAKEIELFVTAGSDFHGRVKPGIEIGDVPADSEEFLKAFKANL